MTILIFDTRLTIGKLYPLALTRPVCDIRHGIFTLREWYAIVSGLPVHTISAPYLPKDGIDEKVGPFLCIDSSVIPDVALLKELLSMAEGTSFEDANGIIGFIATAIPTFDRFPLFFNNTINSGIVPRIGHPMDWVKTNTDKLKSDFNLLNPQNLRPADSVCNRVFGAHPVWMDEGAKASGVIFNTEDGPVYIGKNALVMEGVCIRGPVAILDGAVIKMGAHIYQGTTIGKSVVAGGEIKNSILGDFSNKAHHGYLGDSIVGRWCNLGAGTSNSNVKNNGGVVNMWSEAQKKMIPVGKKAGLVMGDFSKTAINTSLNTGTTIGTCCSLHKPGYPGKHIPSFSWGPGEVYDQEKAKLDLTNWFQFKNHQVEVGLDAVLEQLFQNIKSS